MRKMILINDVEWFIAEQRIRKACRDGYAILSVESDGILMLKSGEDGTYNGDAIVIFDEDSAVAHAFDWWDNE